MSFQPGGNQHGAAEALASRVRCIYLQAVVLAAILATGLCTASAQEPVRSSLAGEAAAAGRRKALNTDYNLLLGPARIKLDGGLDLEFNDNVNRADSRLEGTAGPQSDLFIRPRLNIGAFWQVTQLNTLSLRLGLGYEFSLNDTRRSNVSPITISPDSEIGFDIFIGDFRINLHERFAIENNPASEATLSNTGNYSRFSNTAGITVLWDLNELVLTGGYDYLIERYTGDVYSGNNRDSHLFRLSAAFLLNETTTAGIQGTFTASKYGEEQEIDQVAFTAGPFTQFQISPYTRFLLAAGVQSFQGTRPVFRVEARPRELSPAEEANIEEQVVIRSTETTEDLGYYWTAAVFNRLNSWYNHSLSAGHERQLGLGINYVDIDYIRYQATYTLNRQITLGLTVGYEHYKESRGIVAEELDRWNFGLAFGYKLTQRLRAGVRYSHYTKESDLSFRDYRQNTLVFSFFYDF